ncbi:gag/pol protein [Gossypium australe]|uniref:Gag/pol protein n=1 Tax=Gossypium australe TaxID=47621 RepID=A0A5B6V0J1_9ROSI|nr:gag/pol protein [Gossypium australe]
MYTLLETEILNKRLKTSHSNESCLWHFRLDYINQEIITRLVKDDTLSSLKEVYILQCESCLKDKMTKQSFNEKGTRAVKPLELVLTDVYRPMNVSVRGGYEYYVTFMDDYFRYEYVYLMHCKSENFDKFKEFCARVEKQLGLPIKALRSDRENEILS